MHQYFPLLMDRKESTADTLALAHFLATTCPEQFQQNPPPVPAPQRKPLACIRQVHAKSPDLKPRSTQTDHTCRHCNQTYSARRLSCPSFLPTGQKLESVDLRAMVDALKAQLAKEQASRLRLEQAYRLAH